LTHCSGRIRKFPTTRGSHSGRGQLDADEDLVNLLLIQAGLFHRAVQDARAVDESRFVQVGNADAGVDIVIGR
jgi:hypothetical protein